MQLAVQESAHLRFYKQSTKIKRHLLTVIQKKTPTKCSEFFSRGKQWLSPKFPENYQGKGKTLWLNILMHILWYCILKSNIFWNEENQSKKPRCLQYDICNTTFIHSIIIDYLGLLQQSSAREDQWFHWAVNELPLEVLQESITAQQSIRKHFES